MENGEDIRFLMESKFKQNELDLILKKDTRYCK